MNLKKAGIVLLLMGSLVMVTGCSSEKEEKKEDEKKETEEKEYYDGELTEEEMNGTHLTLELMENVTVDADITSLKDYEKGLSSYFIQRPDGKKIAPGKKKIEGKGYIPKDYSRVKKIIAENVAGTFGKEKEESYYDKKFRLTTSELLTDSISDKKFSYTLYLDKGNKPCGKDIRVDRYYKPKKGEEDKYYISDSNIAWTLLANDIGHEESDFSFGGREEIAREVKEQAEELIGKKLSDVYDGFTVNKEMYDMIVQEWYPESIKCPDDFYAYFFYYDVNGFPWKTESRQYFLEKDEEYAEDVETHSGSAYPMQPESQAVSYGKDGIRELSLSDTVELSKVYKEQGKILPLDEMLIKIGDFYLENASNTLMKNAIYGIKLCYLSDFYTEGRKLRNIVKPCWEMKVGQKHYDGIQISNLYFDAETGEHIAGYLQH